MKINEAPQLDQKRAQMIETLSKRAQMAIQDALLSIPEEKSLPIVVQHITEGFRERGQELFPSHNEAFEQFIEKLRTYPFSSIETLPKEMSKQVGNFFADHFSPEELELRARETAAEQSGWTTVNEALSFEIKGKDIAIHVPLMLARKPTEMMALFEKGLHTLATRVKEDPSLVETERIVGWSWIIYKHPYILKRMGFEVDEVDEERKDARASISREEFLKRYGA